MDYNFGAAIAAGALATVVMTAMLYMGMAALPRQMPMNILFMLGTMMSRNTMMAYVAGTMMHAMMGIAFALVHAAAFKGLDLTSALIALGGALRLCPLSYCGHGYGHDWDYASIDAHRPDASTRNICLQFAQDDRDGVSHGSPCLRPGGGRPL